MTTKNAEKTRARKRSKNDDRRWINGFGIALSEVYANAGNISAIRVAARAAGLDRDDFRAAGLGRYDLEHLRLAGVMTKKQAAAEARRQAARIRREVKMARDPRWEDPSAMLDDEPSGGPP